MSSGYPNYDVKNFRRESTQQTYLDGTEKSYVKADRSSQNDEIAARRSDHGALYDSIIDPTNDVIAQPRKCMTIYPNWTIPTQIHGLRKLHETIPMR